MNAIAILSIVAVLFVIGLWLVRFRNRADHRGSTRMSGVVSKAEREDAARGYLQRSRQRGESARGP